MAAEENRALIRRFIDEVFNQRNLHAIDEHLTTDYVDHAMPPGLPTNREGFKQFIGSFLEAFPDFHYTIEDILADGNRVAIRLTAQGTHQGTFLNMPPTGKRVPADVSGNGTLTGLPSSSVIRFFWPETI